ncbi:MAG: hypothetical protein AB1646_21405 [Thermodesulfobacteriota bacterium]
MGRISELLRRLFAPRDPESDVMPYFGDGKTYSDALGWVSPEGNTYGQTRWIREWQHPVWWDGARYRDVEIAGQADSVAELPVTTRPFGEVWRVRRYVKDENRYVWDEYYWDSEHGLWKAIRWFWTVENFSELRYPGVQLGGAHMVKEQDIRVFWNGYHWARYKHSMLEDDEPAKHAAVEVLSALILKEVAEARVIYVSNMEISLEPIKGSSGKVWTAREYVTAQKSCSLFNSLPVLNWNTVAGALEPAWIEAETEYLIYLANSHEGFVVPSLPADGDRPETPAWDFRGKLFLSQTGDYNGYLGSSGIGANARLVGQIETDRTSYADGGPYFVRELDISLIAREVSLPETLRDYSDYTVRFVAEDAIKLDRLPGTYGQIAVRGALYPLGTGYTMSRDQAWIDWDSGSPVHVVRRAEPLEPNAEYYLYLSSSIDAFNFNEINPETNRPWDTDDEGAEQHYDGSLDMRLVMFCSPKQPENGALADDWPGYYARHVGLVRTDANGRFVNSLSMSAIRRPVLDQSSLEGLAEAQVERVSATAFRLVRRPGTSGVVLVGGDQVATTAAEGAAAHTVSNTDTVWAYEPSGMGTPLQPDGTVADHAGEEVHLYLANGRGCWGDNAGRVVAATQGPVDGYLSRDWPGNNARWLATVQVSPFGFFEESWLAPNGPQTPMQDPRMIRYEFQKMQGTGVQLTLPDLSTARVAPQLGSDGLVIFPDKSTIIVPSAGISLAHGVELYEHNTNPHRQALPYLTGPSSPEPYVCTWTGGSDGWKAFNGDDTTGWVLDSGTNTLTMDFGPENTRDITTCLLFLSDTPGPVAPDLGLVMRLSASADGVEWDEIPCGQRNIYAMSPKEIAPYNAAPYKMLYIAILLAQTLQTARYWRIVITKSTTSTIVIRRIALYDLQSVHPARNASTDIQQDLCMWFYQPVGMPVPFNDAVILNQWLDPFRDTPSAGYGHSDAAFPYHPYQRANIGIFMGALCASSPYEVLTPILPVIGRLRIHFLNVLTYSATYTMEVRGTDITSVTAMSYYGSITTPLAVNIAALNWTLLYESEEFTLDPYSPSSRTWIIPNDTPYNTLLITIKGPAPGASVRIELFAQGDNHIYLTPNGLIVLPDPPDTEFPGFKALGGDKILLGKI